jgi:CBS domain-containing protein
MSMAYRDRSTSPARNDWERDDRDRNRSERGYGEDYRGYTRGYNINREPNYRTETNEGYTGYGRRYDENYGRGPSNSWSPSNTDRYETTRGFTQAGPQRSHLRCRDIMTRNVASCRRDTPVSEVARLMRDQDAGALPVLDENGKLAGIVTDRDLVVRGLTADKPEAELRAEDCMSDDVYTANQNDRVVEVINEMGDHQIRRIPVVDSRDRLVGIISTADIALQTSKDRELADALENISQPSSWLGRLAHLFNW